MSKLRWRFRKILWPSQNIWTLKLGAVLNRKLRTPNISNLISKRVWPHCETIKGYLESMQGIMLVMWSVSFKFPPQISACPTFVANQSEIWILNPAQESMRILGSAYYGGNCKLITRSRYQFDSFQKILASWCWAQIYNPSTLKSCSFADFGLSG